MVLEYTTGEEVSIPISFTKNDHKFVGVTFMDANTDVALDVPFTQSWDEEHEQLRVYFTMPDADIILNRITIESVPANEKSRANYCVCSVGDSPLKEDFKFAYYYYLEEYIPEEHKNVVKEVTGVYYNYWFYEITDWIDNSKLCEPGIHYWTLQTYDLNEKCYHEEYIPDVYIYYFYISGLDDVKYLELMTENESGKSWYNLYDNTFKYF